MLKTPVSQSAKKPLTPPQMVISHAWALGLALGMSEKELAETCLAAALTVAEDQGDPDGWIATLTSNVRETK